MSFFNDHADNFFGLLEKLRLVYTIAKGCQLLLKLDMVCL